MTVHRAHLASIRPLAAAVNEYVFALDEPAELTPFRAGQFVMLRLDDAADAPKRPYSLVNREGVRHEAQLCIKILPEGAVSSRLVALRVGDPAFIIGPYGAFVPREIPEGWTRVLLATGTGIAPFLSMLRTELPREPVPTRLLYGSRNEEDILYAEELAALAAEHPHFSHELFLSAPGASWTGTRGRITDRIPDIAHPQTHYYLCGNPNMVEECRMRLTEAGVDLACVFSEKFTLIGKKSA